MAISITFADIIANPKLLQSMTQTETEVLTYNEQVPRLKELMLPKYHTPKVFYTPDADIPF